VIDNVLWPMTNTYTLRGDGFRHPGLWMSALRDIRDLKPKYILTVGAGSKILKGKDNITQTINAVLDSMAYIYDQSIRLTNQGIAPDQLKHHIQLPQALIDSSPYVNQFYGQWETYPEMYPVRNHGWFSGYAEDIHNLPKKVEADYMIQLAGGMDKMHASWKKAYNKAEYLWAKQLATYLYFSDPANKNSRQALADTFRKLGQYSEGLIVRNFYIEAALSLEGNEDITITGTQSAEFIESDVIRGVNYLRTRINPEKSKGVSAFLIFNIDGKTAGLDIRNSVAEFVEKVESNYRPADVTLTVSANKFARYYEGSLKAKDIASSKALKLLSIFDEYKHIPMYPTTY